MKKPNFLIRKEKEISLIQMIFNYGPRRVILSTGISIPVKYWNGARGVKRVRASRDFPRHKAINQRLNFIEEETVKLWDAYAARGEIPTTRAFKEELIRRINKVAEEPQRLTDFILEIIEERIRLNRPPASIRIYRSCLSHLEVYQKNRRRRLDFDNIGQKFINDFTAYLFAENYSDAYVHKVLTTLKMFARLADDRGVFENSPILKTKLGVKKRSKDHVYLTQSEIQKLFHLELTGGMAATRDLFLIGCLTGLRFSDYSQIQPANIQEIEGRRFLKMTTQKTKQKIVLPIVNPMLVEILSRHGWKTPRQISNQKLNKAIKQLCRQAGVDQVVEITSYQAGRAVKSTCVKYELVSTHTARRSFATNAFKSGMPAASIMRFTGHTTVESFMKYIRVTEEENARNLADHHFFTGVSPLRVAN